MFYSRLLHSFRNAFIFLLALANVAFATENLSIASLTAYVSEGSPGTPGTFRISRSGSTTTALTVNYTASGTAISGTDYILLSGSVIIPAGASSAVVSVTPKEDTAREGNETVKLTLLAKTGYTLNPASASFTLLDNDVPLITASARIDHASDTNPVSSASFRITRSGTVTTPVVVRYTMAGTAVSGSDYLALSGSVSFAAGQTIADIPLTPKMDSILDGTKTVVLNITPAPAYSVNVPSATAWITDQAVPAITLSTPTTSGSEQGRSPAVFRVTRSGTTAAALTVRYAVGGTATAGTDYVALSGSVVIPAGQSFANITVTPNDDSTIDPAETVILVLRADPAYQFTTDRATVTIADNDPAPPTVAFTTTTGTTAESSTLTLRSRLFVTRSGTSASDLPVRYSVGGSATPGIDYTTLSGTAVIPAGQTTASISVSPINDWSFEGTETVIVSLTPTADYLVTSGTATVTILDDDLPEVAIAATSQASEQGRTAGFLTATRTGSTASPLAVRYTIGGTATPGVDYATLSGTLVIPAGQSSAKITVTPVDDAISDPDESIIITLNPNAAYTITGLQAWIKITDNEQPPPAAPANISAVCTSSTYIQIAWTDHLTGGETCHIEYRAHAGVNFIPLLDGDPSDTSETGYFTVIDGYRIVYDAEPANTQWDYRVRFSKNGQYSPWSTIVTATTSAPTPAAPTNLSAVATSSTSVLLLWTANAPCDGYKLALGGGSFGAFHEDTHIIEGKVAGATTTGVPVEGLAAGTTYQFGVRAFNQDPKAGYQASNWSNFVSVTTLGSSNAIGHLFVNDSGYPIISLVVDNAEKIASGQALPPGASYFVSLSTGNHTLSAKNGFSYHDLYVWQPHTINQTSGTVKYTFNKPSMYGLLSHFAPNNGTGYWTAPFYVPNFGSKAFRFKTNGTTNAVQPCDYYLDGQFKASGTYSLETYYGNFIVKFRISIPNYGTWYGLLDEAGSGSSTFYMQQSTDVTALEYSYDGQ